MNMRIVQGESPSKVTLERAGPLTLIYIAMGGANRAAQELRQAVFANAKVEIIIDYRKDGVVAGIEAIAPHEFVSHIPCGENNSAGGSRQDLNEADIVVDRSDGLGVCVFENAVGVSFSPLNLPNEAWQRVTPSSNVVAQVKSGRVIAVIGRLAE